MSHHATTRAWDSGATGIDLLVLLALADFAGAHDDPYDYAYPAVATLAAKTGLGDRTVQRALRSLEASKAIRRTGEHAWTPRKSTIQYRIEAQSEGCRSDTPSAEGVSDTTAEGCHAGTQPRPLTPSKVSARASTAVDKTPTRSVTFDRQRVPARRLKLAEELLDEFNTEAGTSYPAYTGDGKPSEALKRILGALTEHPDIDGAVWSQGLRAQFVDPWWTSTPAPGVVFGRRQREKTLELARSGRAPTRRAESPRDRQLRERQAQADRDGPAMKAVLAQMGIGDANRRLRALGTADDD